MARERRGLAWVVVAVGLMSASPATVRAEEPDRATTDELKSIITRQIEAFGRDDGETAESFAAPGIRQRFPDPKDFVAMVRQSYGALFQPRSTHFDETGSNALGPIQKVTVVDAAGVPWTAVYTFEKVDGQWRINGCAIVKEQSTTI